MAGKDLYGMLGVSRTADDRTIKKAYRKLAKEYHPDRNPNNREQAEKKFKEVNEAYDILKDPEKRKLYDQFGMAPFESGGDPSAWKQYSQQAGSGGFHWNSTGGSGFGGFGGGNGAHTVHMDSDDPRIQDILRQMFGGAGFGGSTGGFGGTGTNFGGDGFSDFSSFGGGSGSRGYSERREDPHAADLNADISIDWDQALKGCDTILRLQGQNGRQSLKVHVPAGIDDGGKIRLKGKGRTRSDGTRGDLYIKVRIRPKNGVERKGLDVYTVCKVPFVTAALGGNVTVRTVYGKNVSVHIPEGTQAGRKIRLRGMGIRSMKDSNNCGDQYITIEVQVPADLTEAEKQKLREFQQLRDKTDRQAV